MWHVKCVCVCLSVRMYSVCEKRSQRNSLRDWSGPQFYVSFLFSYFDSLNFAWENVQNQKKSQIWHHGSRASRTQAICEWGQSSGKPIKKFLVIRIGIDSTSHFLAELSGKTTMQKSVHYPHETGHRDLPAYESYRMKINKEENRNLFLKWINFNKQ